MSDSRSRKHNQEHEDRGKRRREEKYHQSRDGHDSRDRRSSSSSSYSEPRWDDKDGHLRVDEHLGKGLGEQLPDGKRRYKMIDLLGEGTFGRVVECFDRRRSGWNKPAGHMVAVKVIKNVPKYRDAAKIELEVLRVLNNGDPDGRNRCVNLRDDFDFRGHICMVFDLLGISLYDFMKENAFRPFELPEVQHFALQLMSALDYMHAHKLTHTDLKPENIMVDYPEKFRHKLSAGKLKYVLKRTDIHVIDFGSATFEDDHHTSIVSTRHYRAPEVILALTWSYPCDMWSIGCILMELYTGSALFQTHDDIEHLAMMEQMLGTISTEMAANATRMLRRQVHSDDKGRRKPSKVYFDSENKLLWPEKAKERDSKKFVKQHCKPLKDVIAQKDAMSASFLELMEGLLVFEDRKRLTSRAALKTGFLANFSQTEYAAFQQKRISSNADTAEVFSEAPPGFGDAVASSGSGNGSGSAGGEGGGGGGAAVRSVVAAATAAVEAGAAVEAAAAAVEAAAAAAAVETATAVGATAAAAGEATATAVEATAVDNGASATAEASASNTGKSTNGGVNA